MTRRGLAIVLVSAWILYIGSAGLTFLHSKEVARTTSNLNDLWLVVSGEVAPSGISPADRLAADLADFDFDNDTFVAAPNDYRHVSDEIGFNPFMSNGLNCSECGFLDFDFRRAAISAQEDGSSTVVAEVVPPDPSLTPAGWQVESVVLLAVCLLAMFIHERGRWREIRYMKKQLAKKNLLDNYLAVERAIEDIDNLKDPGPALRDRQRELKMLRRELRDIALATGSENKELQDVIFHHEGTSDEIIRATTEALKARREAVSEL